jgi:hypothetical protein
VLALASCQSRKTWQKPGWARKDIRSISAANHGYLTINQEIGTSASYPALAGRFDVPFLNDLTGSEKLNPRLPGGFWYLPTALLGTLSMSSPLSWPKVNSRRDCLQVRRYFCSEESEEVHQAQ